MGVGGSNGGIWGVPLKNIGQNFFLKNISTDLAISACLIEFGTALEG
jgi:hypothetical protein